MAKSRAPLIWLYALSLLAIGFIWGNSLLSQSASGAFSSRVEAWLLRLLHLEALPFDVRKLAHFCEYAALGALSGATFALAQNHSASRLLNHALLGLLAAVIDESIQVLSGRGPLVTDIWIDAAGYGVGLLTALLLWRLLRRLRPKRA